MTTPFCSDCDAYLSEITSLSVHIPTEEDIFGPRCQLVSTAAAAPMEELPLRKNYGYDVQVISIIVLFGYIVYNFRDSIAVLFRMGVGRTTMKKIFEEQTFFFRRYLNLNSLLIILVSGTLVLKLGESLGMDRWVHLPAEWMVNLLGLMVLMVIGLFRLYHYLLGTLIRQVTLSHAFFEEYRFNASAYSALAITLLTPLFLLFDLSRGWVAKTLLLLLLGVALLLYLFYLGRSCRFFLERNVSILHWILYLCIVDLFPFSLVLCLALKIG